MAARSIAFGLAVLLALVSVASGQESRDATGAEMGPNGVEPDAQPTTEQLTKIAGLKKKIDRLSKQKAHPQALQNADELARLQREAYGPDSSGLDDALTQIEDLSYKAPGYRHIAEPLSAALELRVAGWGTDHWKTVDMRWAVRTHKTASKMPVEARRELVQLRAWNRQVSQLYRTGNFREAVVLAEKVKEQRRQLLGTSHPCYATSLNNLAMLYFASDRRAEGLRLFAEVSRVEWDHATGPLAWLSGSRQRQFIGTLRDRDYVCSELFAGEVDAETPVEAALLRKQLLVEAARAQRRAMQAARKSGTPAWQARWQRHVRLRRQCAQLTRRSLDRQVGVNNPQRPAVSIEYLKRLRKQIDQLEEELRRENPAYARLVDQPRPSHAAVLEMLEQGEALLDYVKYHPSDFKSDEWSKARCGVFVVRRDGVTLVNLGDAEAIDQLVKQYRVAVTHPVTNYVYPDSGEELRCTRLAAQLRHRVLDSLDEYFAAAERLLVCPDGGLSLMPFEALVTGQDDRGRWRYLVEQKQIVYLATARDPIRLRGEQRHEPGAVLVGDPDIDMPAARLREVAVALREDHPPEPAELVDLTEAGGISSDPQTMGGDRDWPRMRATGTFFSKLGEQLERRIHVRLLVGPDATEPRLWQIKAPRVLQFATHGDYQPLPDGQVDINPLARSMLILAGANRRGDVVESYVLDGRPVDRQTAESAGMDRAALHQARLETGDGLLTAYEVAGLDLRGTELVNITACETTLGDTADSQSVAGLRQAVFFAGARPIVMSMWQVPLDQSMRQMEQFYAEWLSNDQDGMGRRSLYKAFHHAQLSAREHARTSDDSGHALWWAGFVCAGHTGEINKGQIHATAEGADHDD